MRILKILLAEYLDQLNKNGVSLDLALSGALVLPKQSVVEGLHQIGQISMAKILDNKQGKLSPSMTKQCTGYQSDRPKYLHKVIIIIFHFFGMN